MIAARGHAGWGRFEGQFSRKLVLLLLHPLSTFGSERIPRQTLAAVVLAARPAVRRPIPLLVA